jgi:cephalosporin hydroxylase
MTPTEQYVHDRDEQIRKNLEDRDLGIYAFRFHEQLARTNYVKNFTYMGVPILQLPGDLMVMQEILWDVYPDVVIETGIAFGGMLKFYARMLPFSEIIGIDIDIREHTRDALNDDHNIVLFEGSSIDIEIVSKVKNYYTSIFKEEPTVFISLDSCHSHDHVLQELRLYSPLVSVGSYVVVFDTAIEKFAHLIEKDRPWGLGNNPATAVAEFMRGNEEFIVDREAEQRAGLTAAPGGWLRRIR